MHIESFLLQPLHRWRWTQLGALNEVWVVLFATCWWCWLHSAGVSMWWACACLMNRCLREHKLKFPENFFEIALLVQSLHWAFSIKACSYLKATVSVLNETVASSENLRMFLLYTMPLHLRCGALSVWLVRENNTMMYILRDNSLFFFWFPAQQSFAEETRSYKQILTEWFVTVGLYFLNAYRL